MDEDNERAVWQMLLRTAAQYSAQYLYLAPKFPRGLPFSDDMSVTVCFSGLVDKKGKNKKKSKWLDLDRMIEKARNV